MKENKKSQRSTSESNDLLRKRAIEVEDNVYRSLCKIKIEGLRIERSPRIGQYFQPDFVLYNARECIAVIEVKTLLRRNSYSYERALTVLQNCLEITQASYGFLTDGKDVIDVNDLNTPNKTLSEIIEKLEEESCINRNGNENSVETLNAVKESLEKNLTQISNGEKRTTISDFIQSLTINDIVKDSKNSLTDKKEKELMYLVLGKYTKETICRYTSMSGLFRTLNDRKQSMVCLVGMNDRSEIDYVDSYFSINNQSEEKESSNAPCAAPPFDLLNKLYILSCCDEMKEDNLTMFRLYGDDSRGVCLRYTINHDLLDKENFFLAPVSYADENGNHPELDYVLSTNTNAHFRFQKFDVWKHFFKKYDYKIEDEVRLLYDFNVEKGEGTANKKKKKWVNISSYGIICPIVEFDMENFPFLLDKIILGTNSPESKLNANQLRIMFKESNNKDLDNGIEISQKDSYRTSH